nr:WD repeat-containing protein 87 [Polyrhizophydium stewartii]
MIQAHAGSIVSVSCDGTGDKLFSTSRDSTIRIWSIEYLDSGFGNSKILENAQHKLSGGPVHILLTLFATIQTTPIDGIPMRCCYSSMVRILAVAMENHSLRLFTIGLNRNVDQMKHHPRDEDHTKSVMDIAVFETQHFCVFASCGEMQFENPMWSVCFGNARGDLMVGLSDQIALVQVQDYLPAKYLLRLLERDWPDDPIESSTTFDAALDFWKLYREQIKAAGNEPALWHVAPVKDDAERPDSSHLRRLELERWRNGNQNRTDFEALHRFLERPSTAEAQAREKTPQQETQMPPELRVESREPKQRFFDNADDDTKYQVPEMSFDIERMKEGHEPKLDPFSAFTASSPVQKERELDKRSPGQAALDSASKAVIDASKTEFQMPERPESKPAMILDKPRELQLSRERVIEVLERARARKAVQEIEERRRIQAVADALQPSPNQKLAQRKGWILENMIKIGVAPNSVIAADVSKMQEMVREQQRRDREEREAFEKLRRMKEKNAQRRGGKRRRKRGGGGYGSGDNDDDSGGSGESRESREDGSAWDDENHVDLYTSDSSDGEVIEGLDLGAPADAQGTAGIDPVVEGQVAEVKAKKPKSKKERTKKPAPKPKEPPPKKRAARVAKIHPRKRPPTPPTPPPAEPETDEPETTDQNEALPEEHIEADVPPITTQVDDQPAPEEATPEPAAIAEEAAEEEEEPTATSDPGEASTGLTPVPEGPSDTIQTSLSPPPLKLPPLPFMMVEPVYVGPAESDREWSPVHHIDISEDIASKLAWDLFKTAVVKSEDQDAHQQVLDQFGHTEWFEGIGDRIANLSSIIDSLFGTLRNSSWQGKVQAAKGLMYMYHTFKEDIQDPVRDIVNPQLERLDDPNWQVRTQIINNLASYEIYSDDIVFAMILALADPNPRVVEAAINTLGVFGISSRYALRNAMIRFQMINPSREELRWRHDPLDVSVDSYMARRWMLGMRLTRSNQDVAARMRKADEAARSRHDDDVLAWLRKVDPRVYGQPVARPDSSVVTLCLHTSASRRSRGSQAEWSQARQQHVRKRSFLPPIHGRMSVAGVLPRLAPGTGAGAAMPALFESRAATSSQKLPPITQPTTRGRISSVVQGTL